MYKEKEDGYMTVETAVWLPGISILMVLLIFLCSYLYQGCFLAQTAYLAAFRGSRVRQQAVREARVKEELDELTDWQVLSFEQEQQDIEAGPMAVTVRLSRKTPFLGADAKPLMLTREKTAICLDPVDYIRGLQFLSKAGEQQK